MKIEYFRVMESLFIWNQKILFYTFVCIFLMFFHSLDKVPDKNSTLKRGHIMD
jgi:hypothetical protein